MSTRRRLLLGSVAAALLPSGHAAGAVLRVVSVGGAVTEVVHAVGAADALVGVDSTSTYPPPVERLPRVGYMRQLSAEGILSLRPTLVLATAEAGPPAVIAQIESAGVRVIKFTVRHSVEALRDNVATAAAALGREADGTRVLRDLDRRWRETSRTVPSDITAPRVLFVMAHGGGTVMAGGRDTAADAMIRYASATNAAGALSGYRPLTAEAAIAAAPDVILATTQGLELVGSVAAFLGRPGLAHTPAGRTRRVVAMEASYLLGFGPRLPEAVAELARRLRSP